MEKDLPLSFDWFGVPSSVVSFRSFTIMIISSWSRLIIKHWQKCPISLPGLSGLESSTEVRKMAIDLPCIDRYYWNCWVILFLYSKAYFKVGKNTVVLVNIWNSGFELLKIFFHVTSVSMKVVLSDGTEIGMFMSHVWALNQVTTAWRKGSIVS